VSRSSDTEHLNLCGVSATLQTCLRGVVGSTLSWDECWHFRSVLMTEDALPSSSYARGCVDKVTGVTDWKQSLGSQMVP
jgi:hypothetical protein